MGKMRIIMWLSIAASQLLYTVAAQVSDRIHVNQIGYYPAAPKLAAVVAHNGTDFEIRQSTGAIVYSSALSQARVWDKSNESVRYADFSEFREPGTYFLHVPGLGNSHTFQIGGNVLEQVMKESVRYFYYNRASTAIEAQYAGIYARAGGHWDTDVIICDNDFPGGRPAGTRISSPGGWYDAGDYNKYIQTAGISVYTLLSAYEQFPEYVGNLGLNIPESNSPLPDLIDECLYELRWMFTMQDSDGGVYTKLSNTGFGGMNLMPDTHTQSQGDRYVCRKNTPATLQFAASMAAAYRILEPLGQHLPGFRDSCLAAAKAAWDWSAINSNVAAGQCGCNITTGAYGDNNPNDEFIWAAAEMYLATGDISYYNSRNIRNASMGTPDWNSNKEILGYISLLLNKDKLTGAALQDAPALENKLAARADVYYSHYLNNPYRFSKNDSWDWGSNGDASNQSFVSLSAYNVTGNRNYLEAALSNIDYMLGRNPTGYCFLTGFGHKRVYNSHHRISYADGIHDPVPGMLFGGPYLSVANFMIQGWPDGTSEYAMTEVTINWNAPFAFASIGLQALLSDICPAPDLGGDINLCETGSDLPLLLDSKLDQTPVKWWINGAEQPEKGQALTIAAVNDPVTVIRAQPDIEACPRYGTISLHNYIEPANIGPDRDLENGQLVLDAGARGPGINYKWYINGQEVAGAISQTFTASESGKEYMVELSSAKCPAVRSKMLVAQGQRPFNKVPAYIPGTVYMAEYDIALSPGTAFYDTSPGNQGGAFRTDNVDIEPSQLGGYNIGYTAVGEWLEFTVYVGAPGIYDVSFMVASATSAGRFSLSINGNGIVPDARLTGVGSAAWQDWKPLTVTGIELPGGTAVLRWQVVAAGFNIHSMQWELKQASPLNQELSLDSGWNLMSHNVHTNKGIAELLSVLPAAEAKSSNSFYSARQAQHLNSLAELQPGHGYWIYAGAASGLQLEGLPHEHNFFQQWAAYAPGWHLSASPAWPVSIDYLPANISRVLGADVYWDKYEGASTSELLPGKAYYFLSEPALAE
jgi:endoglucanase